MHFLAFVKESCYKAPIFKQHILFVMGAIGRLRDGFVGAAAMATVFAAPACAQQDDARATAPSNDQTETVSFCIQPENYPVRSCATEGYETEQTLDQILSAPELDNVIVLHFGEGLLDAGIVASDLDVNVGLPAVAIPGGPEGRVQLIIARYTTDRMVFTQDHVDMGRVGNVAQTGYPQVMERKAEARRTASSSGRTGSTILASASPGGND